MIQDWCKVLEAGAQAMAAPQKNPQDHPTNTASWGHLPAPPPQSQHALTPETPHYETHSFLWGKDYRKDCTQTSSPSRAAQADTKPTPEGSPPPTLRSCQGSTRCWNLLLQHPTSITLPSNTPIPFFFFSFFFFMWGDETAGRRGSPSHAQRDTIPQAHPSSWCYRWASR